MSQSGLGRSADVEIFCTKRAARALRVVEVDAWPLYTLVQWSIAQAGMKERAPSRASAGCTSSRWARCWATWRHAWRRPT